MSSPITGKNGKLTLGATELADVQSFSVSRTADIKTYASSSTSGYEKTLEGNHKWTLSAKVFAPSGSATPASGVEVGSLVAFTGTLDTGKTIAGNVRISSISVDVSISTAETLALSISATGDGAYVITG